MSNDPRDVESALHYALDRGINFFDTADTYHLGGSERMLGWVFRGRREEVIIATKVGTTLGKLQILRPKVLPFVKTFVRRRGPTSGPSRDRSPISRLGRRAPWCRAR